MKKEKMQSSLQSSVTTTPSIKAESSKIIIEVMPSSKKDINEFIQPEWKEKVLHMIKSFPHLPNSIEDMIQYYTQTFEYFALYELDPFDPRLDRVEQKLELLSRRLGLHYEVSKTVKLKARQLLAYN